MKRFLGFAALIAALFPAVSSAVDLKNMQLRYGPVGAVRANKDVLPGDIIYITYDIENLAIDPTTNKASYVTTLQLLDSQDKVVFENKEPLEVMPQLGGTRMPGVLNLLVGLKRDPGKYSIRLTVQDKYGKDAKAFKYDFKVAPAGFGIVGVNAPTFGFPGQFYQADLNLINMTLDAKKKPDTEVSVRILDQNGKSVTKEFVKFQFPRDLPAEADLDKVNLVPVIYPIYLNRAGRFTMEIKAHDKIGNKKAELSYPFTVVDINNLGK